MAQKQRSIPANKKGDWIVRVREVVTKEIYCWNCTEKQAESNPYDFTDSCTDEVEIDISDMKVLLVERND